MGYSLRQTSTGKFLTTSVVHIDAFDICRDKVPHIFGDIGTAKAAITRAIKFCYGDTKIRELCLELEIVEVTINVVIGEVVFSQLFRANEV